jgi:hypothetical protein
MAAHPAQAGELEPLEGTLHAQPPPSIEFALAGGPASSGPASLPAAPASGGGSGSQVPGSEVLLVQTSPSGH